MKNQSITRNNLKEIWNIACSSWKQTIERWLKEDPFLDKLEFTQERVNQMFKAADASQKKVLLKFFKEEEKEFTKILTFKDVLSINKTTRTFKLPYSTTTKDPFEKCQNALAKMFQIAKAYNGSWVANIKDTNQYKYFIYKYFSGSGVGVCCGCSGSAGPLGVYLKSEEDMKDAYSKFKNIYDDYFMF